MPSTTIRIDTETRDRLRAIGRMGESYDQVVRRLLENARFLEPGSVRGIPYRLPRATGLPSNLG